MAAAAAKRSRCSNSPCGTYDRNGIRFLCGQCIREHMGPQLPSFAERLERFTAFAAAEARRSSPASTEEERGAVAASAEVDEPRRMEAPGDGRRQLSDASAPPHLRRPVERDSRDVGAL